MPIASIKVETPRVPNFLLFADMDGKISIADVPDDQLEEIADAWKEALLERADQIRRDR